MTWIHRAIRILATAFVICVVMPWIAAGQQAEIATAVAFTEGPAVDPEGNVYFTDIINQRIMKLGRDGVLSTFREKSNAANGLFDGPQGRLIACEGAEFVRPGVKWWGTAGDTYRPEDRPDRGARRDLRGQAPRRTKRCHH